MKDIKADMGILVRETAGWARAGEWVRSGLPCPQGLIRSGQPLQLRDQAGKTLPVQTRPLNHWHDGSVKWLLVDFAASLEPGQSKVYRLRPAENAPPALGVQVIQGRAEWRVDTGAATFVLDTRRLSPLVQVLVGSDERLAGPSMIELELADGRCFPSRVSEIRLEDAGPLRAVVALSGEFCAEGTLAPRFRCRLDFFAGSAQIRQELTLHNPQAARHPGGLWDLGDPASLMLRQCRFRLPLKRLAASLTCIPEPGVPALVQAAAAGRLELIQTGSGGGLNGSTVHRDARGAIPGAPNGYRIVVKDQILTVGRRATPVLWHGEQGTAVGLCLPRCWQEFPKSLAAARDELTLELFPAWEAGPHELQGGEQKTHLWYLDFSGDLGGMEGNCAPLAIMPEYATLQASRVFADLPASAAGVDLVDRFLVGPAALNAKRETLDEYGWRHFGEVPADHEAVYHQGSEPFVSHYNNQYDLCAGLYRKALATGDPEWQVLAADLARHVRDIDLYHTGLDREEYNQGLFWHTDHYLDAGLATHRSFSREHLRHKEPRFCGGGPSAEHCYTGGLTLHYLLTGDPLFRDAVLNLAQWGLRSLGGPWTVLATLKRHARTLARLRRASAQGRPVFPRFPLTRGTGNVLCACLDAFELGGGGEYLAQAGTLIRGALHPGDDPGERDLLNAEIAWSYTVLLVAIGRYLDRKSALRQWDEPFHFARAALLTYADWMRRHEYPYLEKPEILEYPNETWAAQDLRKAVIFHQAARYAPAQRQPALLERADYFFQSAADELARHATSSLTRPLALMLQNGWVGTRLLEPLEVAAAPDPPPAVDFGRPTPRLAAGSAARRVADDLLQALKQSSPRREWAWLRARLG